MGPKGLIRCWSKACNFIIRETPTLMNFAKLLRLPLSKTPPYNCFCIFGKLLYYEYTKPGAYKYSLSFLLNLSFFVPFRYNIEERIIKRTLSANKRKCIFVRVKRGSETLSDSIFCSLTLACLNICYK